MHCADAPFSGKRNEFRSTQQAPAADNVWSTTKESRIWVAGCLRSGKNRALSPKGVASAVKNWTSTVWTKNFNHASGSKVCPLIYFPAIRCAGNKLICLYRIADRYGILFFDNSLLRRAAKARRAHRAKPRQPRPRGALRSSAERNVPLHGTKWLKNGKKIDSWANTGKNPPSAGCSSLTLVSVPQFTNNPGLALAQPIAEVVQLVVDGAVALAVHAA